MARNERKPRVTSPLQFFTRKLCTPRMACIVVTCVGVTVKAQWNGVLELVTATFGLGHNVMNFDFHALVSMADATVPGGGN